MMIASAVRKGLMDAFSGIGCTKKSRGMRAQAMGIAMMVPTNRTSETMVPVTQTVGLFLSMVSIDDTSRSNMFCAYHADGVMTNDACVDE